MTCCQDRKVSSDSSGNLLSLYQYTSLVLLGLPLSGNSLPDRVAYRYPGTRPIKYVK